jgi:PHD/YefM family antitoxin component YafN of YafNO toxin-antitoxin module
MIVISSREFREHQKKYFELVDKKEKVIVQRGKDKAYLLTPVNDLDIYLSDPEIRARLDESIKQAKDGDTVTIKKDDIKSLLDL